MSLLRKASIVTTPTAYENGKILSVKPSVVLGEELITNGNFATDSDWILGNNTTISGGKLINSNSSAYSSTRQSIPMSVGTYLFTYTIDSISGGGFFISFTGFNGITRYAAGTYSEYVTLSSASTTIFLAPVSSGMTYTIDNVSVKEAIDADFDFTRNSSATRVNSQGLIEDMQILSGDLVSNGDFSQEGSELIANGDFSTDSDWTKGTGWSISSGKGIATNTSIDSIYQNVLTLSKSYKASFTISSIESGSLKIGIGINFSQEFTEVGTYTYYGTPSNDGLLRITPSNGTNATIDNVSVKEVGQDWTLGGGWIMGDGVAESDSTPSSYLGQEGVILTTNPHRLTFQARLKTGTNGTVTALIGGSNSNQFTIADTNWQTFTYENTRLPSTQTGIYFNNDGNEIEIDNISVKEITEDTNLPRIDYTGGEGHWLFEGQSTNLLPYSEDFSNAAWVEVNATTLSNQSISPDGTLNADKLTPNNTAASIFMYNQVAFSASDYTLSFFVKYNGKQYVQLLFGSNVSNAFSNFDLLNKTVTSGNGNIEDYGNGWFKISLTANSIRSATSEVYLWSIDSATSPRGSASTGNGVDGYHIYGAMLEQNSYPTSYIPTEGSIKTRLQDAAFGAGSSDLINSTEGVLYAEIARESGNTATTAISLYSGSASNIVSLYYFSTSSAYVDIISSSGSITMNAGTIDTSVLNKIAVKYKNGDNSLFLNGVKVATSNATVALSGLDRIDFNYANGSPFLGKAKCVAVFKEALTDAELTCLTTI